MMIIAVFSEFREFKHFGFYESISAGVGVLIIGFSIVFTLLMIRKTIELLEHRDMSQLKYLSEFFAGIKNKSIPLFYTTAFMFRRTILCGIVIFINSPDLLIYEVCFFVMIQTSYLGYVSIFRPFVDTKDNIYEIFSEICYTCLCGAFFGLKVESDWNKFYEYVYLAMLMAPIILFTMMAFSKKYHNSVVFMVRDVIIKIKK